MVAKLDRLARSVPDAREIADLLVERGVKLALELRSTTRRIPSTRSLPPSPSSKAT